MLDTLVRGTISKGRFVQGAQHPRIFVRGHIGRGHINPASRQVRLGNLTQATTSTSMRWSRVRTNRSGTRRASSKGRFFQGTLCPRVALSKGNFVQGRRLYVRGHICRGHFTTLSTNVIINPILYNSWLENHALTLKSNIAKYYFGEKSIFLHTFLKFAMSKKNLSHVKNILLLVL